MLAVRASSQGHSPWILPHGRLRHYPNGDPREDCSPPLTPTSTPCIIIRVLFGRGKERLKCQAANTTSSWLSPPFTTTPSMVQPSTFIHSHLENLCCEARATIIFSVKYARLAIMFSHLKQVDQRYDFLQTLRAACLIPPQHGCWKWEQHLQPNTSVNHALGFWHPASKMLPSYHSINNLHPFAHCILPMPEQYGMNIRSWQFMDSFITHILFAYFLIDPGGLTVALAGHQCWSVIPLHTGLVLTPLANFTDLTDCGLNVACLVFSTCPSRFATLVAQFPPILIIHQLVMLLPGRLP